MSKRLYGVDLGGTNIVVGVIDKENKIVAKASRKTRAPRPAEEMEEILRFGHDVIPDSAGDFEGLQSWRVGVVIPFDLIGIDSENLPHCIRANFYKCGDKTAHPHYLSWSPIDTPKPDFHRPEFFGELLFD